MVIQDCAYYEGKRWYAYELKDMSGKYDEEYRLKMRKESQKNAFTCPDCGEPLILCAGVVMEPFFKHHEDSNCIRHDLRGSNKSFVAKRMLYYFLKQSYPGKEILSNVSPEEGIYIDFVIELEDYPAIAVKYIATTPLLEQFEQEYEELQMLGYQPIYIMKYQDKWKDRPFTTFEYLVSKLQGEVRYIDIYDQSLFIKKVLPLEDTDILMGKKYPLMNLYVREDGSLTHDLNHLLEQEKQSYEEEREWDMQYQAQDRAIRHGERMRRVEERRREWKRR